MAAYNLIYNKWNTKIVQFTYLQNNLVQNYTDWVIFIAFLLVLTYLRGKKNNIIINLHRLYWDAVPQIIYFIRNINLRSVILFYFAILFLSDPKKNIFRFQRSVENEHFSVFTLKYSGNPPFPSIWKCVNNWDFIAWKILRALKSNAAVGQSRLYFKNHFLLQKSGFWLAYSLLRISHLQWSLNMCIYVHR